MIFFKRSFLYLDKKNFFIFFLFSIFYLVLPFLGTYFAFIEWHINYSFNTNYQLHNFHPIFFLLSIIIYFFLFHIFKDTKSEKLSSLDEIIFLDKIVIVILCFSFSFLILDFYQIINEFVKNREIFTNRGDVYNFFLNKRLTHIKIITILSVYLYDRNKVFSILCYSSIFLFCFFLKSRYEIFILILLHFYFNNFSIDKKNKNILYFLLSLIALTFINRLHYSFTLNQNLFKDFFGEFFSVYHTSLLFFENFFFYIKLLKSYNFFENFFKNNLLFFFKDFFYFNYLNIFDFWKGYQLNNRYANLGITYVVAYPIVFLFYYLLIIFIKNKFYYFPRKFYTICFGYILIVAIRSNVVHELGFILKLILLLFFAYYIGKILKKL
jgi:hypothetical protein